MPIRPLFIAACLGTFLLTASPLQAEAEKVGKELPRQRPGGQPVEFNPFIYESLPDINSSASAFVPVHDRWRQFYAGKWYDPYNQNVLKGDVPIFGSPGHEWFLELSLISDTLLEHRKLPIPVGGISTARPNSINTFGRGHQNVIAENVIMSVGLIRGNTTFKPPEFEFRAVPVFNISRVDLEETGATRINPTTGTTRNDNHMGFQELFADIHLANISDRYDFISSRLGIQRFSSDFRGFVFSSDEPGARLFGSWDNNRYQYNLAWFSRLDKDTNSGINTFDSRHENVFVANVYRQDSLALGHTLQANIIHRRDQAGSFGTDYDNNGFLIRPAALGDERSKNLQTTYFGINGDGHINRINLTESFYFVTGSESHNQISERSVDISAGMAAIEASYDINWIRIRTSAMWASGDSDPFDSKAHGFDSIVDNPNFAGGDLSFWQRQGIPLIGGGGVNLVNRNSLLPDLKPGKEEGQSNFVNPGLRLLNVGADFEITPKLKLITNASYLQFDSSEVLKTLRQDGSIGRDIGFDLSAGLLYRPFLNNNVQFRLGAACLIPGKGTKELFDGDTLYDVFGNIIFQY